MQDATLAAIEWNVHIELMEACSTCNMNALSANGPCLSNGSEGKVSQQGPWIILWKRYCTDDSNTKYDSVML